MTVVGYVGGHAAHGWSMTTARVSTLVHWRIRHDGDGGERIPHHYPRHYTFIESALLSREMTHL
ncbi:hypothetical protein [Mycolicibacterium vaccae]|uniref:hypothetical protein n=1 Tax=Mycolicibacterium vaccae TaxID=1810 RepID=UPI003D015388